MPLILYNGKLLRTLNGLAGSLECCCPCCVINELFGTEFEFEGESFVVEVNQDQQTPPFLLYYEEIIRDIEVLEAAFPRSGDNTLEFIYVDNTAIEQGLNPLIEKTARVKCGADGVWRVELISVCGVPDEENLPTVFSRSREWTAEFECDQETGAPKGELINVTLISDTGDPPDCIPALPDIRVVSLP